MPFAEILLTLLGLYLGLGLLFAFAFVLKGASVIDPSAQAGTIGFRLLIFPGAVALWPVLAKRWLKRSHPPAENNPHRRAARAH
ncbi:hypothetical protein HUU05_00690 [candidate division KSB1 bacterium]|nr:hypothetical protein [candidate division KSB1 bacterium]